MPRAKKYIDTDVLTEAKNRIRHVFDLFDTVVVMFSGGKDSLVVVHLVWEVAQELGHDHINVVFRDEELIPDTVVDFVNEYRQKPWIKMLWYAVPRSHRARGGVRPILQAEFPAVHGLVSQWRIATAHRPARQA